MPLGHAHHPWPQSQTVSELPRPNVRRYTVDFGSDPIDKRRHLF